VFLKVADTVIILFLFDTEDMGILAETRVQIGVTTPVLKNYKFMPLSVRKIPSRRRNLVIREYIDKTDLLAIVVGTYTFMRPSSHYAMVYGFTKNRPMMAISEANINDGWSKDITAGPNPFTRLRWNIHDGKISLYALDSFLEVVWRLKTVVPRQSVRYRLKGVKGYLNEIAPMYDWVLDDANKNFPAWVRKSIWLAGL
jgi:hypothetical protein